MMDPVIRVRYELRVLWYKAVHDQDLNLLATTNEAMKSFLFTSPRRLAVMAVAIRCILPTFQWIRSYMFPKLARNIHHPH